MNKVFLLILSALSYAAHAQCSVPWGGTIPDGSSVHAYYEPRPPKGEMCRSEYRTCRMGMLSGSYRYNYCYSSSEGPQMDDGPQNESPHE